MQLFVIRDGHCFRCVGFVLSSLAILACRCPIARICRVASCNFVRSSTRNSSVSWLQSRRSWRQPIVLCKHARSSMQLCTIKCVQCLCFRSRCLGRLLWRRIARCILQICWHQACVTPPIVYLLAIATLKLRCFTWYLAWYLAVSHMLDVEKRLQPEGQVWNWRDVTFEVALSPMSFRITCLFASVVLN